MTLSLLRVSVAVSLGAAALVCVLTDPFSLTAGKDVAGSLAGGRLRRLATAAGNETGPGNSSAPDADPGNWTLPGNETADSNRTANPYNGSVNCLCVFDVDRTLTGQQGITGNVCPRNKVVVPGIYDTAYGGGPLTLSELGQAVQGTFCGRCFTGVVSTGSVSGADEKALIANQLGGRGRLPRSWHSGPSGVRSPLVRYVPEGAKQQAVQGIVNWYNETHGVRILPHDVYFFDDKAGNVEPFVAAGFNAREVSCASRDGDRGLCGATLSEVQPIRGVITCR